MVEVPAELARLRTPHPEYTGPLGAMLWSFMRDALDGTGGFGLRLLSRGNRALTDGVQGRASYEWWGSYGATPTQTSYLPRYPREHVDLYAARVERAVYYGYCGPIAEEYQGFLHATPPQRTTTAPEVTRWWADTDGAGTGVDALMAAASDLAQTVGWAAILVDRAAPEDAGAERFGVGQVATVARVLQPEELVDWQHGERGALEWARLRTCTCERDPFGVGAVEREQYTTWTADAFERVDFVRRQDATGTWSAWTLDADPTRPPNPLRGENPTGAVPVVVLYQQRPRRHGRLYGTTFLYALARANLDLFGLDSQIDEHLCKQVFGILAIQSENPDVLQGLKLGSDNGLRVEMGAAMPQFVTPPAEVYVTLAARRDAVVGEVYRLATMTQPSGTVSEQSGAAKAWDFGRTNAALAGFAANLEACERDLVRLVAAWDDAAAAPAAVAATSVAWPRTFDVMGLVAAVETHLAVLDHAAALPPTVARQSRLTIARKLAPQATPAEATAATAEAALMFTREVAAITPSVAGAQVARVPVEQLTSFTLPYLSTNEVRMALNASRITDPSADVPPILAKLAADQAAATVAQASTDGAAHIDAAIAALPDRAGIGGVTQPRTNGAATTGSAEAT